MSRPEGPALAAALHLPEDPDGESLCLTYHSPRTTVFEVQRSTDPVAISAALGGRAISDATVVATSSSKPSVLVHLETALPGSERLTFDPLEVHRFLFAYLDHHDPMALGHASDRVLFDETFLRSGPPSYRTGRRQERRIALDAALSLLRTMGHAVGLEPPFPRTPEKMEAWGLGRVAGLADLTCGLIAALLRRWGSPLAVIDPAETTAPRLVLADRWLRERSEWLSA